MKTKYLLTLLAVAMIAGVVFIKKTDEANIPVLVRSGEGPVQLKDKHLWEFERLRDPKTGKIPAGIERASAEFSAKLPVATRYDDKGNKTLAGDWQKRGPHFVGGRTRALAIDKLDNKILLAGGVSGGMWKSTDNGTSWVKKTTSLLLQSVSCIAQDTREGKENIWYYGTGEYFNIYGGLRGDGIMKSTDGGETWFELEATLSGTPQSWDSRFDYIWNIVVNHKNLEQDELFAATAVGCIVRSTDGGESWTTVLGGYGNEASWFTDIEITANGVFYATLSQRTFNEYTNSKTFGIYRSLDGVEWTKITPEFMPKKYRRVCIGVAPSDENQVYFLAETPEAGKLTRNSRGDSLWHSIWKYTYVSDDGSGDGGQWDDRSSSIPRVDPTRLHFNSQGSYDLIVKVHPENADIVYIGGTSLYRSTDGFETSDNTTQIGGTCPFEDCDYVYRYPNHHSDQHAMVFHPANPNMLYTGSDGGVIMTEDNLAETVEWTPLNNGYYTTQFYHVGVDPTTVGSDEIIGGLQDNGTLYTNSANLQQPWTNPATADGFCCVIPGGAEFHYTSQNSSNQPKIKIYRALLDDDGEKIFSTRIDPIGGEDFIWNTPYLLDPNDNNIMYLAGGRLVWRNNDLSLISVEAGLDSITIGWDSLHATRTDSITPGAYRGERISALGISTFPSNILYYGTTYGRLFRIDSANIGDPESTNITFNQFPRGSNLSCIAVDPKDGNRLMAVFSNFRVVSIFYSEDAGMNWIPVSGNLEEFENGSGVGPAVQWVEIVPVGDRFIYFAATSTGLYSTSYLDGKYTVWQRESPDEIGNTMIWNIDSRAADGFVAVGTYGIGVYSKYVDESDIPAPPAAIALTIPEDGARAILDRQVFEWEAQETELFYKLQISTDSTFNTINYQADGISEPNYEIRDLDPGLITYYWRVAGKSSGGMGEYSETFSFTTATSGPKLVYPEYRQRELPINLTLLWEEVEGATSYRLEFSKYVTVEKGLIDSSIIGTQFELKDLLYDRKYYWRVTSASDDGIGFYSDKSNFRTQKETSVDDYSTASFTLTNISPNPFKTSAMINFVLNDRNYVSLKIYSSRGKTIKTLLNKTMSPGTYSVVLNSDGLTSGEYYCNLKVGKENVTKKIVLLR